MYFGVVTVTMCTLVRPAEMHTSECVVQTKSLDKKEDSVLHRHIMNSTDTPQSQFSLKLVSSSQLEMHRITGPQDFNT